MTNPLMPQPLFLSRAGFERFRWIPDLREFQPAGGSGDAEIQAVQGAERGLQAFRRQLAVADDDEGAGER